MHGLTVTNCSKHLSWSIDQYSVLTVARHTAQVSRDDKPQSPLPENIEILARLKTLEDKVSAMGNASFLSSQSPRQPPAPTPISRTSLSTPIARTIVDEDYRTASELLESVGASYDSNISDDSHGVSLRVEPVNYWPAESYVRRGGHSTPLGTIWLPTKTEALSLLKYYMDNIHYLHPVIDALAVRKMLETVYSDSGIRFYREAAHIALLLSIFASTGYLWTSQEHDELLVFSSPKVATQASSAWSDAALDVADYSRRTSSGSIENIQATIIIEYLIYNNNGFSATCRILHSNTISMARDLSLHRIDIPHRRYKTESEENMAEDETKRRIWWYVASTDWLLAFSGGPQEGTYLIHPAHMHVRYPQIVSGDLIAQSDQSNGSESTPTSMAYFLQRIRLSEICRTIVDSIPRYVDDIDMIDYDQIVALDDQFEDLIKRFPVFFHLDEESRLLSRGTDHKFPHIATQRYLIHLGVLNRRCKLHQPYLRRGFVESKYAFSRDMCLRSARNALEVNRVLEKTKSDLGCAPARFGTVVHHVFMATVVLVMDLCFNKIEGQEEQRQAEVMGACRMLREAKQDSVLSKMFLDPLMDILQKHRALVLSDQKPLSSPPPAVNNSCALPDKRIYDTLKSVSQQPLRFPGVSSGNQCTDNISPMAPPRPASQQYHMTETHDCTGIDEIMQNYIDFGPNMDIPRWNELFADLDSHKAMDGNDFFYE
ncbi:hypothetical protein V490_01769 [Pseudogymnoascus sp. VKM F-3557]|nr:hypothetical protein V490_01769 [Pseudogymnoascus sp. VKM F-3557]